MIELNNFPVDITDHIQKFRKFLNLTWDHVVDNIMDEHDWDNDSNFALEWLTTNWEFLVERELLGKELYLAKLAVDAPEVGVINPNKKPDFAVFVNFEDPLYDIKSLKRVPSDSALRLFFFVTVPPGGTGLAFGPSFEIVGLVNVETSELYYVPIEKVRFFLYPVEQIGKRYFPVG